MGTVQNHYDRPTICVDLDGTLALDAHGGNTVGPPLGVMVDACRRWRAQGWRIVVATARPQAHHPQVAAWLLANAVPFDQLVLGSKPAADAFVDDRGLLLPMDAVDAWVAWLLHEREDPRGALHALADGSLHCRWTDAMEAVPENPQAADVDGMHLAGQEADYRVVVLMSGGIDSTVAWWMAQEAGLPAEPLYVGLGQRYHHAEYCAVLTLLGEPPHHVMAPPVPTEWGHILPRRNAVIALAAAQWMASQGWWGELWLGNLAGETPAVRGDKSARWAATTQQLLAALGHDVQLVQPLRGLDKPDLVRWAQQRGLERTLLLDTWSCFDVEADAESPCGRCQACFRKMVAFEAAGVPTDDLWDCGTDWRAHVAKYDPAMRQAVEAGDWSRYSPARCRDTLAVIGRLTQEGAGCPAQ